MALNTCLPGEVREDALRSVPPSEDSQRFVLEGRGAEKDRGRTPDGEPSTGARAVPPGVRPAPQSWRAPESRSVGQSPVLWAALGAGAMLVVGGMIIAAVLLLR
jgi:hypothetical protein